jgi:hypothetical protein
MRNYVPLLVILAFVGTHAMEEDAPVQVNINYYALDHYEAPVGYIPIIITPNTTDFDMQDVMRQRVGPGTLRYGPMRIGERNAIVYEFAQPDTSFFDKYSSPHEAKRLIEAWYAFWQQ